MLCIRYAKTKSAKLMLGSPKVSLKIHEQYGPPLATTIISALENGPNKLKKPYLQDYLILFRSLLALDSVDPNELDQEGNHPVVMALREIGRSTSRYECEQFLAKAVILLLMKPQTNLCPREIEPDPIRNRAAFADIVKFLISEELIEKTHDMMLAFSLQYWDWRHASIIFRDAASNVFIATSPSDLSQGQEIDITEACDMLIEPDDWETSLPWSHFTMGL